MRVEDDTVHVSGLPAGRSYELRDHCSGQSVWIDVVNGVDRGGVAFGPECIAELSAPRRLDARLTSTERYLEIEVRHPTPSTRVHVVATRYRSGRSLSQSLFTRSRAPLRFDLEPRPSHYLTGRKLSDEYRYVLDRQSAPRFPGVLLERPGLLLNPWLTGPTRTNDLDGPRASGSGARGLRNGLGSLTNEGGSTAFPPIDGAEEWNVLDFLPFGPTVLPNLVPDASGRVRLALAQLENTPMVSVVVTDLDQEVARNWILPPRSYEPLDLTLSSELTLDEHYAQVSQVTAVEAGGSLTFEDVGTARVEIYPDLASVHRYFRTTAESAIGELLTEFAFLLEWPTLEESEKRRLYSEYACHELHFFIHEKDPEFFQTVVLPFLQNKKDPTFLDGFLTGDDLSEFLDPWRYQQLNVFEQILLGGRIPGEAAPTARSIRERAELVPVDPETRQKWFVAALANRALDGEEVRPQPEPASESSEDDPTSIPRRPAPSEAGDPRNRGTTTNRGRPLTGQRDSGTERPLPFYRSIEPTAEYAENNYYRVTAKDTQPSRIRANPFWAEYALHRSESPEAPFVSTHFPAASNNLSEMLLALAVLDLPFSADAPTIETRGPRGVLEAATPVILFHREVRPSNARSTGEILTNQCFFRNGRRLETLEFQRGVPYDLRTVVTNPSPERLELEVLIQIPQGSLPLADTGGTRSEFVRIESYESARIDSTFYFPRSGNSSLYPAHVSRRGTTIAWEEPRTLRVVDRLSDADEDTWEHVSQLGSDEDVLAYLERSNAHALDLTQVAWRLRDPERYERFGAALLTALAKRKIYSDVLWSYSLLHGDTPRIAEYLRNAERLYRRIGSGLVSPLVTTDAVERKWYEHLEYRPLINARAHPIGGRPRIQSEQLAIQYGAFCENLSRKARLEDEDRLAATYYLLVQDRIGEALEQFARVDRSRVPSKLQYDYLAAYLDLFTDAPRMAAEISNRYRDYAVPHWRARFRAIRDALDPASHARDETSTTAAALAEREPTFDLRVEAGRVTLDYRNLDRIEVNYYPIDVELRFSSQPFARGIDAQWAMILPTSSETRDLPQDRTSLTFELPQQFRSSNVIVEAVAAGKRRFQSHHANSLSVTIAQNYGRLVVETDGGVPLAKTYVKVYARLRDGTERFYKDGYTDHQGRFDYVALSTDTLDQVEAFALLVLNDQHGATIREVTPPAR